jgi:2-aminoethylphosphonate-pyruvate transaminase
MANGGPDYDCVLMQGSGTFAMEAALGSFCPAVEAKTLVMANGIYGARAAAILKRIRRRHLKIEKDPCLPIVAEDVASLLDADPAISHVWVVHCENTAGVVNPLHAIATVVKDRNRLLMVDAMASFGALPLDMEASGIDVMVGSSDKCLEGVPGFSYVLARRELLVEAKDKCHSLVLDLHAQWKSLEANGHFRFTPPTHALVALHQALKEHERQGGVAARGARYARTASSLVKAMREMGFTTLLDDREAGPIIQTFLSPRDPNFDIAYFQEGLRIRGFAIQPGQLVEQGSFLIGSIGQIDEHVIQSLLQALRQVLRDMNVTDLAPQA